LRDLLIDKDIFEKGREAAILEEDWEKNKIDISKFEKTVLPRLRKKRSVKKYRKTGINKTNLKEIIQLAEIASLELFHGPSNKELADRHPEWCNHCGICCIQSSPLFIHRDERIALITLNTELEDEIIDNKRYPKHFQFKEDKPCKFYDFEQKRCKIYYTRPQVCQNYPLMLMEVQGKEKNVINLRYNCNYAVSMVLQKSIFLFDKALEIKFEK